MPAPQLPEIRILGADHPRLAATDLSQVQFSTVFSDHMFVAEYADGAWRSAQVQSYGPLALPPNISALQYAVSVFEGLKAQRLPDGRVALFRPIENARRLNRSAARLAMPEVPEAFFMEALRTLVRKDAGWVPAAGEGALYIRPTFFSVDPSVRVKPAEKYLFVIFTFPFSAYYAAPVDALVSERYVRAFPGGTGEVKPAGNYAPALIADLEAQQNGCATVLWLDGVEHRYVEECGVMNLFFVLDDGSGPRVVTPPLGGTILPGVTRDSAIVLLREMGLPVEERRIAIDEVVEANERGALKEAFGMGTAATLSHLRSIRWRGQVVAFPSTDARPVGEAVRERLTAIARGLEPDTHGWLDVV